MFGAGAGVLVPGRLLASGRKVRRRSSATCCRFDGVGRRVDSDGVCGVEWTVEAVVCKRG